MQRIPRCFASGLLAVALGAGWDCGTSDVRVLEVAGGADAGVVDATSPALDAPGKDAPASDTGRGYCQTSGPPVLVATTADGGTTSTCPEQLAQRAFRYALCACQAFVSDHALVTDAFDGTQGSYESSKATQGGSVGVNGSLHPGPTNIGGSLWASGATDITTSTLMKVTGELHAQGELHPGSLVVQADAWMESGIQTSQTSQTSGDVTVQGTLHIPVGAPRSVAGMFSTGAIDTTPFQVPTACDCDPSDFVDVAGVVRTYEDPARNDDEALGIKPSMLENVQTDLGTIPLPCGRIFLTEITGTAPIHLTVVQRVALFVKGDLSTGDFTIEVPLGSELDLFVGGSVNVRGAFELGDVVNPARARTYVGGSTVNLQSAAVLLGNLYAPSATIVLGGTAPTTLYGSIFALGMSLGSDLTIHYDEAILTPSSPSACPAPTTCTTCNDCNGQACFQGNCSACTDSMQCCRPLVCRAGTCVADVIPR